MIEKLFNASPGIPPPAIPPTVEIAADKIVPGARIIRYTELLHGRLVIIVPCCGRRARLKHFHHWSQHLILCVCETAYAAETVEESDGGYRVILTVEEIEFIRTRR